MQSLLPFIKEHWALSAALVVIVILIIIEELRGKAGSQGISPQQATQLINREDAVVVDVREESGFKSGHIVNAVNYPAESLLDNPQKLAKFKNRSIIIVCAAGVSSANVCAKLRAQGYEKVHNLNGGMNAWRSAGLPATKV